MIRFTTGTFPKRPWKGAACERADDDFVVCLPEAVSLARNVHHVTAAIEVVPVPFSFRPSAGPAEPVVWQDEHHAVVVFETDANIPEERAVLRFEGCLQARFGYPNDEALPGHPLYEFGLRYYGVFEVRGSSWLDDLGKQNRVAFPSSRWPPRPFHHFVVTFHDTTFEALSMNVGGHATNETVADVFARLASGERA